MPRNRRPRTGLPLVLAALLALPALAPGAGAAGGRPGSPGAPGGPPPPVRAAAPTPAPAPASQVADEVDLTTAVPRLQAAFGDRYGGHWIETRGPGGDVLHVAVVGATRADADVVADLTGRHPRVVTDATALGYRDLVAAQEEVARTLAGTSRPASVSADVATGSVVVRAAAVDAGLRRTAEEAARRGPSRARASAPGGGTDGPAPPASDPADAVVVERDPSIAVTPAVDRVGWRVYEAGLRVTTASAGRTTACTSGFTFGGAYGYFGSTAGHCNSIPSFFGLGSRWIGAMALNRYDGVSRVAADVSFVSLTANRVGISATIRSSPSTMVDARYRNSQLAVGLRLCFDGIASDAGNCGTVVRANEWVCCDATRHSFLFTCIDFPLAAGDSGGPVYHPKPNGRSVAAGMVSSSVTLGNRRLTCFTNIENIERETASRIVLR